MKKFICLSLLFVVQITGAKIERPASEPSHKLSVIRNMIRTLDDFFGVEWLGYKRLSEEHETFIKNIIHELNMDDYCIEIRGMSKLAQHIMGRLQAFVMPSSFHFGKKSHTFLYIGQEAFAELSDQEKESLVKHELMHIKCNHQIKHVRFNVAQGGLLYCIAVLINSYLESKVGQSLSKEQSEAIKAGCFSAIILGSLLLHYKYSRLCEKEADIEAVKTMKDKQGMIDLLNALEEEYGEVESRFMIKRMFYKVVGVLFSPLTYFYSLFTTHPAIKERIAYIRDLE